MKQNEIVNLSVEELNAKLAELRKNLMKENAQIAIGTTPKSPGMVKNMKKTIAKILFTLNKKSSSKEEIPKTKKQKEPVKEKTVED